MMRKRTAELLLALLMVAACAVPAPQSAAAQAGEVRQPMGAGQFYSKSGSRLEAGVKALLSDAVPARPEAPIALVAPHAGYIYSGQIAADAYKQVAGRDYATIVILGTNHTTAPFRQAAIFAGDGFRTPLGVVRVDADLRSALLKTDSRFVLNNEVHASEHSIEVHLPFIQHLFPKATILPVVIGASDWTFTAEIGRKLAGAIENRPVLIVASSDLSHYPVEAEAVASDRKTLEAAASLDPDRFARVAAEQASSGVPNLLTAACGEGPILVAMHAALALGATRGVVLSYANSAEAPVGDRTRVVGYGALAYTAGDKGTDLKALERPNPAPAGEKLQPEDKKALLAFARKMIERLLTTDTVPLAREFAPRARRLQGAFVTLKKGHDLRGCIGHIPPDMPLARQVGAMALQAAFNDPRFEQLRLEELRQIEIEISALTPPKRVGGPAEIVVGRDGVVLRKGDRSAVFLPQVAVEQGWGLEEMLDNLSVKAGLPRDAWRKGATFETFQAEVFSESRS